MTYSAKVDYDLCPNCYKTSQEEKSKALQEAEKFMDDMLVKAAEEKKRLLERANVTARAFRVPRIEADSKMRAKYREKVQDGG